MSENNYIFDATEANFTDQVLERSNQIPILVDFWAAWCQPCRMLMPLLQQLVEDYKGKFWLAKVNTDEEQALALQYGVRSLPTLKLFRNGKVAEELVGLQQKSIIRTTIDRHIVHEADLLMEQAKIAWNTGQQEQSLNLLHKAIKVDPENHRVSLVLAETLLKQGEIAEAEQILKALPLEVRIKEPASSMLARIEFITITENAPEISHLEQRIKANPEDSEAHYLLGVRQTLSGHYQSALEQFMGLLKRDRKYRDDGARKALLAVFNILGSEHELVTRYRRQMFRYLH
ncbi:MAG: thioredoxin [Candidatus Nitrosoglobus sp.]|jgi:putative thioredoxin